jgi:FkbM family methyltransferase
MARAVGMNGRVVAIEPTPRLSALLCRNAWMNSLEGVITVEACALGAERGSGLLSIEPTLGHNSLLPSAEATNSISVPIRGLDDVLPPGAFPALVKLDVEGFELEVWRGMARTIAAAPDLAVIVEFGPSHLARAGIAIADWIGTFLASGFTPWEIAEDSATIRPLRTDGLDRVFSMNILLLRADPARWPRLVRA